MVLTLVEGEGTGETEAGRGRPLFLDDDGDPAAIGAVDTAKREET